MLLTRGPVRTHQCAYFKMDKFSLFHCSNHALISTFLVPDDNNRWSLDLIHHNTPISPTSCMIKIIPIMSYWVHFDITQLGTIVFSFCLCHSPFLGRFTLSCTFQMTWVPVATHNICSGSVFLEYFILHL